MDNQALKERISSAFASGDFEGLSKLMDEMVGDDFVLEYPQSGERFNGWDTVKQMNSSYEGTTGTAPKMSGHKILEPGKAWVFESTIDYGDGTPVSYVAVAELRDGRIARITDYFGSPFEAPAWREQWVERIS